jgi:uncharacterized protein YfcZ (UPF0381/DUF406 family)
MATNSAVTYVQVIEGDLDVIPIYKELMEASTGVNSVYIRTKETLEDMFKNDVIKDPERAGVVSQTLSTIATAITSDAMNAAIKIATENRDAKYVLTKLREDTKLTTAQAAKIEADIAATEKDTDYKIMQGWRVQAELYRDFGVNVDGLGLTNPITPSTSYSDYGTKVETLKKAKVDTYATYANSYRTNGKVSYTTNILTGQFDAVSADTYGLTAAQTNVAIRQKEGFDDNMRQHVVNSSASLAGLLLSTEQAALVGEAATVIATWNAAANYLSTSTH